MTENNIEIVDGPKVYGYLRASTAKQEATIQKPEILMKANSLGLKANVEWIIDKTVSGTIHWKKRELGALINKMKKGDVLICVEMSRLGRSLLPVLEFIDELAKKECTLYCTRQNFEINNTMQSQIIVFALSLVSQLEHQLISDRTKAGLTKARENGKLIGRQKGYDKLSDPKRPVLIDKKTPLVFVSEQLELGVALHVIAQKVGVTAMTLGKFMKKNGLVKLKFAKNTKTT